MLLKAQIMDEAQVLRTLARMTHEIIEKNGGADHLCLVGIRRRGIPLAYLLAENIKRFTGTEVPVGFIDITLYRDDLTETVDLPSSKNSLIPCDLASSTVVIVDDVLYTGRTARAAIEAIFSHGRPRAIQLAVLIDRGHRELPIRPDFVGKNLPTSHNEVVAVLVDAIDGSTGVNLMEKD